jgi:opacity protein-like surface antigen
MWKLTLLIMGLTASIVTQANAQNISLGPQIGYFKAMDADKGNIMGGAICRIKLTPVIGAEASINYRQEKYANDALTIRSWPVMVTGLIYPLPIVYGAIGAGWYNTTFDYNQNKLLLKAFKDQTKQEFGWHFGGGAEFPVASNLKLTADIRYVFLNYNFKEIPGSGNLNSNFYIITVGFLFNL